MVGARRQRPVRQTRPTQRGSRARMPPTRIGKVDSDLLFESSIARGTIGLLVRRNEEITSSESPRRLLSHSSYEQRPGADSLFMGCPRPLAAYLERDRLIGCTRQASGPRRFEAGQSDSRERHQLGQQHEQFIFFVRPGNQSALDRPTPRSLRTRFTTNTTVACALDTLYVFPEQHGFCTGNEGWAAAPPGGAWRTTRPLRWAMPFKHVRLLLPGEDSTSVYGLTKRPGLCS